MGLKSKIRDANRRIARSIYMPGLDTVEDISKRRRDFAALRTKICEAGTDDLTAFANGYTHEGGLHLQQNPDEFTALCLRLKESRALKNYLEIGSASGGACYFLWREIGFTNVLSVDAGKHPRTKDQEINLGKIPELKRFVGDSHSKAAETFLSQNLTGTLDVALIDGDHSHEGVWQDIKLALKFSRPGTLLVLHHTVAHEGVKKAWLECAKKKVLTPVAEYIGATLPLGIGVGTVN